MASVMLQSLSSRRKEIMAIATQQHTVEIPQQSKGIMERRKVPVMYLVTTRRRYSCARNLHQD